MEDGRWKIEDGRWKIEDGRRAATSSIHDPQSSQPLSGVNGFSLVKLALAALILSVAPAARAQSNSVLREVFRDIGGGTVADLTNPAKFIANMPDEESLLTALFEAPTDVLDSYGQRLRAIITAPASGSYTCWIASDDASNLYLSTNTNPAIKTRIAYVSGWTGSRAWTTDATNYRIRQLFAKLRPGPAIILV